MNEKDSIKEMFAFACKAAQFYNPVGIYDQDDFVQNVMLRTLTKDLGPGWKKYLNVTMKFVVSDVVRKNGRSLPFTYSVPYKERDLQVLESVVDPRSMRETEIDLMPRLKNVLTNLSAPLRTVLVLYSEGCSYEEIASMTNVSIGTVRSRLHHARKRAKKMFMDVA